MSRRISISARAGGFLLSVAMEVMERHPQDYADHHRRAADELRSALVSLDRRRPSKVSHKSRKPTKAERRDETAVIWDACWERCGGVCECGCGLPVFRNGGDLNSKGELEHPFSKGRGARLPQSVETCWILRADCHRDRHAARPDAETWWRKFIAHALKHRSSSLGATFTAYDRAAYAAQGRLQFVETRSRLGAGLKERHRKEAEEKIRELESKVHKAVFAEEE